VKEFDGLRENFHAEAGALLKESKDISKDIMEELISENPNIEKLKELAEKYGKVEEKQKQMMIDHLLEVKGKCSGSQQANFKRLLRQIENHDRNRMNRERRRNNVANKKINN